MDLDELTRRGPTSPKQNKTKQNNKVANHAGFAFGHSKLTNG